MSDSCIIIVDPFSSGGMLAEALQTRGAKCVAVESSPRLPEAMKSGCDASRFVAVVHHEEDFETTLDAVRTYQPTHVLAGFESGVELAEQLGEQLALPTNGPRLRAARRDKFLMTEAVRAQGLRTAVQFQSSEIEDILTRVDQTLAWPVVLKPPKSVATDHVFCCQDHDQVRRAVDAILSHENVLGERNPSVLVQQFLAGTEYAVDTVSCGAQRKVTGIWQYHRPPGAAASYVGYDAMTLLPYEGQRQQALRSYAFAVLDALEIYQGPAHCELMWVQEEPVLIEVGARLSAGNNATLSRVCGGICQLDETVEAVLAPERFVATLHDQPQLRRGAANVFLMPHRPGRLIRVRGLDAVRQLPTLHRMSVRTTPGEVIDRVAGLVTLVAEDPQALERDLAVIRNCQRQGIFIVEDELPT